MSDTIFAVSSGSPPAAIGVIRVSGPDAGKALRSLCGRDMEPRRASLAHLRDDSGSLLDEALVLWFPGPSTATGEDLAEFHCHGGRAVLAAVGGALGAIDGLRAAEPGEFTRRAFVNGRIDLSEAEGLADLLAAETELQRAAAMAMAGGAVSRETEKWRDEVLRLSAQVEAALDFSDEDDVTELPACFTAELAALLEEIDARLTKPRSVYLVQGFPVAIAGPPNAGKSSLFNALVESEAAITSPIAGTTRDVIKRSVAIHGVPFTFIDMAGFRDFEPSDTPDPIEVIGIQRGKAELGAAKVVLWLGEEGGAPTTSAWEIWAKADLGDQGAKRNARHIVSATTGQGLDDLKADLVDFARRSLPAVGEVGLTQRQFSHIQSARINLGAVLETADLLLKGEHLRRARQEFDRLIGRAGTEDMLDALFGRFCIGK